MPNLDKINKEEIQKNSEAVNRLQNAIRVVDDVTVKLEVGGVYCVEYSRDETFFMKITSIRHVEEYEYDVFSYQKYSVANKSWYSDSDDDFQMRDSSLHYYKILAQLNKLTVEDYLEEARKSIDSKGETIIVEEDDDINENGLMSFSGKETYKAVEVDLIEKKNHIELIKASIEIVLQQKMNEIKLLKDKIEGQVAIWNKKIGKLRKVIATLELYAGIQEELEVICEGEPASQDETLHIRQMMVYFDEELADPRYDLKGLTFEHIDEFFEWLGKDSKNYSNILPEKRCMVAARLRRNKRRRHDDDGGIAAALRNMQEDKLDMQTFLLVRNGENVYVVASENINFYGSTFPKKKMMENVSIALDYLREMKPTDKITKSVEIDKDDSSSHFRNYKTVFKYKEFESVFEINDVEYKDASYAIELLENRLFNYKMSFALFQGLIDRANIFVFPERISVFDTKSQEKGYVKLIYDDEIAFPSNRIMFKEWQSQINEQIQAGSRIVLAWNAYNTKYDMNGDSYRFDDRFSSDKRLPSLPNNGLYEVKKTVRKVSKHEFENGRYIYEDKSSLINSGYNKSKDMYFKEYLSIRYNPGDEVGYNSWSFSYDDVHERKNNLSWKISTDDKFIINYDLVDRDSIEFYMNDRINRRDYLHMMPILNQLREVLIEEEEKEKYFIELIKNELSKNKITKSTDEIKEAVKWWKLKNKIKRPITKEEDKAYRMIMKKLSK